MYNIQEPVTHLRTYVEPIAHKYHIRIDRVIEEPSRFQEEIVQIRQASENDIIHVYVNSDGGYVATLGSILSALEQSPARVVCELELDASSAATFIFLAGDEYIVSDNASFMIHEFQYSAGGTSSNVKRRVDHEAKQCERMVRKYYKHFLTDSEIEDVLNGHEMYLDSEEIIERLEIRSQKMQEESEVAQQEATEEYMKAVFGEPLPVEALEPLDKETLIRVIRGDLSEEEENELFGEHLSGMFEDEGDYEEDCVDESFDNQEQIDEIIQTQVITYLKQVADENDIKYAKNIGIETLRKRILEFFED